MNNRVASEFSGSELKSHVAYGAKFLAVCEEMRGEDHRDAFSISDEDVERLCKILDRPRMLSPVDGASPDVLVWHSREGDAMRITSVTCDSNGEPLLDQVLGMMGLVLVRHRESGRWRLFEADVTGISKHVKEPDMLHVLLHGEVVEDDSLAVFQDAVFPPELIAKCDRIRSGAEPVPPDQKSLSDSQVEALREMLSEPRLCCLVVGEDGGEARRADHSILMFNHDENLSHVTAIPCDEDGRHKHPENGFLSLLLIRKDDKWLIFIGVDPESNTPEARATVSLGHFIASESLRKVAKPENN